MKFSLLTLIFVSNLFSMDQGTSLYSSCKFCHGFNAEKSYIDVVPIIKNMQIEVLEKKLKLYKTGNLNIYGYGQLMKQQMSNIPDNKISTLVKYIKSL